jgi:hypothetical protein
VTEEADMSQAAIEVRGPRQKLPELHQIAIRTKL